MASRCRLSVVADPELDQVVGVAVEGVSTCADVVDLILRAPALPDPVPSAGRCPPGKVCLDGEVY